MMLSFNGVVLALANAGTPAAKAAAERATKERRLIEEDMSGEFYLVMGCEMRR